MHIVDPDVYLQELGWAVESAEDGAKTLVRIPQSATEDGQTAKSTPPNTELGLLVELVQAGYMSDKGFELVENLNSSYSGLMTAHPSERDLETAVQETSKACPVQKPISNHSVQTFTTNSFPSSVSPIDKFAMQAALVDNARRCYPYSNNSSFSYGGAILRLDAVPENQAFDIDNPWDVDAVLGYQQPEQCSDSRYLHFLLLSERPLIKPLQNRLKVQSTIPEKTSTTAFNTIDITIGGTITNLNRLFASLLLLIHHPSLFSCLSLLLFLLLCPSFSFSHSISHGVSRC